MTSSAMPIPPPPIALTPEQMRLLDAYADALQDGNRRINLTAITDRDAIFIKHFWDTLAITPHLDALLPPDAHLIDVGTGGGIPGLVLAIARPTWRITLLDATRKKVHFVEETARTLGLNNVRAVWGRAEEVARESDHREQYDAAVARAVAPLRVLAELCLPFVRVGGWWCAMKGPAVAEEAAEAHAAIALLGGEPPHIEMVEVPGADAQRAVVLVRKHAPTPERYPRRAGVPHKRPLG
ncbi:hypothetical protein SE16_12715 [Ardenticatena maritima]|uniref:Ribosomal RNA small subunit methyltransferase G n=2 Tax=Ardenticatena maritima TaxID=872965 RepID=A0A0P6YB46_9CHLR|nr:hypothetical protein SE16_12715 [Ardenticatena maritima]